MAKRLSDTDIWKKQRWFRKLLPEYKLAFCYVKDQCDHAGIWNIDCADLIDDLGIDHFNIDDFIHKCNIEFDKKTGDIAYKERMRILDNGYLWITQFVQFQYQSKDGLCNVLKGPVMSALQILGRFGILEQAKDQGFLKLTTMQGGGTPVLEGGTPDGAANTVPGAGGTIHSGTDPEKGGTPRTGRRHPQKEGHLPGKSTGGTRHKRGSSTPTNRVAPEISRVAPPVDPGATPPKSLVLPALLALPHAIDGLDPAGNGEHSAQNAAENTQKTGGGTPSAGGGTHSAGGGTPEKAGSTPVAGGWNKDKDKERVYNTGKLEDSTVTGGEGNSEAVPKKSAKKVFPSWDQKPDERFLELPLPEKKIETVRMWFFTVQQTSVTEEQVLGLWNFFKHQFFDGTNFYAQQHSTYNHFLNKIQTQNIKLNGNNQRSSAKKSGAGNVPEGGFGHL